MTTAYQILQEWLKARGYDGLCHSESECGCSVDDLMPCGEYCGDCEPAYAGPGNDDYDSVFYTDIGAIDCALENRGEPLIVFYQGGVPRNLEFAKNHQISAPKPGALYVVEKIVRHDTCWGVTLDDSDHLGLEYDAQCFQSTWPDPRFAKMVKSNLRFPEIPYQDMFGVVNGRIYYEGKDGLAIAIEIIYDKRWDPDFQDLWHDCCTTAAKCWECNACFCPEVCNSFYGGKYSEENYTKAMQQYMDYVRQGFQPGGWMLDLSLCLAIADAWRRMLND